MSIHHEASFVGNHVCCMYQCRTCRSRRLCKLLSRCWKAWMAVVCCELSSTTCCTPSPSTSWNRYQCCR